MGTIKEVLKQIKEGMSASEWEDTIREYLDELFGFIQGGETDLSEFEGLEGVTVVESEELGSREGVFDGRAYESTYLFVVLAKEGTKTGLILELIFGPSAGADEGKIIVGKTVEDARKRAMKLKKRLSATSDIEI